MGRSASLAHHAAASVSRRRRRADDRRAWRCYLAPRWISTADPAATPPLSARAALLPVDAYSPLPQAQVLALA